MDLKEDVPRGKEPQIEEFVVGDDKEHSLESRQGFPERISDYINSESFLENLKEIERLADKSDMIGAVTEYFILNPDGQGIENFVKELRARHEGGKHMGANKDDLLLESVKTRLGFDVPINDLDTESIKRIYDYIYDHLIREGYVFHGFNGAFESSIRERGLDPDHVPWNQARLDEVAQIGHSYGLNILGLHSVRMPGGMHTSSGKNYYDFMPGNFYEYAIDSPEWFCLFCGSGKNKNAFRDRDYDAAKENVSHWISLIQRVISESDHMGHAHPRPLTAEDESKILSLFEDCWTKFASEEQRPKVALIHKSAIRGRDTYDMDYERQLRMNSYEKAMQRPRNSSPDSKPEQMLLDLLYAATDGSNEHAKHAFVPEDIAIVDLPAYSKAA